MIKKLKGYVIGFILGITSVYAIGTIPSLINVNVNDGDVLTKEVINNLYQNIEAIYNWLKGGFTTTGQIEMISNNTANKTILQATGLSFTGDFVIYNLKTNHKTVTIDSGDEVLIEGSDVGLRAKGTNKGIRVLSDGSLCMGTCW